MINEYEILNRAWKNTLDLWYRENQLAEKYHDELAAEKADRYDKEMQELAVRMKEIELEEAEA